MRNVHFSSMQVDGSIFGQYVSDMNAFLSYTKRKMGLIFISIGSNLFPVGKDK